MDKTSKKTSLNERFYLSIYYLISEGLNPTQIASKLNISKQALNYYIKELKRNNQIEKVGYGVWEVKKTSLKEVKKTSKHGEIKDIRSHGFIYKLNLQKNLRNWDKREQYLIKNNIKYKSINPFKSTQSIFYKDCKVWLSNKSIIVFFKEGKDYLSESAKTGKNYSLYDFIRVINGLELLLKVPLKSSRGYSFNIIKQHQSKINDELAKMYNREGKKLEVRDEKGKLWLIIDDSLNLNETECQDEKRADIDMDYVIKPFLNQLRETQLMPYDILNMFKKDAERIEKVVSNQELFAENFKSHVQAIQDLSKGVRKFNSKIDELIDLINRNNKIENRK